MAAAKPSTTPASGGASKGATAAALRRRTGAPVRKPNNVMNLYTDDSPGMKLPPVMVIVGSVIFILIVTMLHVVGKIAK